MTAVTLEALTVRFGPTLVLDRVDLDVREGELFFLLGPSGCGKTTLLRAVAGFVEPDGGVVRFAGRSMGGVPPAKRDCGMVFQNYALWPHLTVEQNVAFGLDVRRIERREKERRVHAALELVKMAEFKERTPNRLSGGQQQRVALARALVVDPQVLLLDEPLSNLDAALRVELRQEIKEIQRKSARTALYVTHDRAEALALADRIAVLRNGRIEQIGAPRELYDQPRTPFVAGFVGDTVELVGTARAAPDAGADGRIVVAGPFGTVSARAAAEPPAPGRRARLVLRPERLRIAAAGAAEGPPAAGCLAGTVARRTFLGELIQHDVALAGGEALRVLSLGGAEPAGCGEGSAVRVLVMDALAFGEG